MQGTRVTYGYHTAGTLAADHSFIFTLPFDATLVHVSAVATNASSAILDVGKTGALEAYVLNKDVGDSSVPATVDAPDEFVGGNYPHILAGTVIIATLDFDGAAGTAAQNFSLVLTFTEG